MKVYLNKKEVEALYNALDFVSTYVEGAANADNYKWHQENCIEPLHTLIEKIKKRQ